MANTRAIVTRRKAVRNIRKITRTMELIATARYKKAFDRATKAEAYTRRIAELAADLSASAVDIAHPLLEKHDHIHNSLLLVLTSNRGLCGGYNASILREAVKRVQHVRQEGANLHLELSGKKVGQRERNTPIGNMHDVDIGFFLEKFAAELGDGAKTG